MMKLYALDLNKEAWVRLLEKLGEPKFRTDQLLGWLWQKHTFDAEQMTNLSKKLREKLAEELDFAAPVLIREQRSKDGTRKFLWQLRDGNCVESVLLKYGSRLTACISTQVGCPLGCTFCATGLSGFVRNLSSGEIAGQFLAMEAKVGREINNVVYMGMGEPMLNKDEVFKSVRMLNDEKLRGLGIRHITISTSGIVPGIEAMAEEKIGARLAVSLHAVDDELRSRLMPVNERYPLAELKEAIKKYQETTGDRVSIEYALFGGVNDSVEHARALVRFLKGIHVFINLIPFNAVDGRYDIPQAHDILKFRKVLETAGFENELRQEQGADIDAACGQLRRKDVEGTVIAFEPAAHTVTKKDGKRSIYQLPKNSKEKLNSAGLNKNLKPKQQNRIGNKTRMSLWVKTACDYDDKIEDNNKSNGSVGRDYGRKTVKAVTKSEGNFYENIKRKQTSRNSEDSVFEKSGRKMPRKKMLPEKNRYRSGKLKEERPVYKGQKTYDSFDIDADLPENSRKTKKERSVTKSPKVKQNGKVKTMEQCAAIKKSSGKNVARGGRKKNEQ